MNNKPKSIPRFSQVINAAISIALLDGGSIVALQVITFLINYFFIRQNIGSGVSSDTLVFGTEQMLVVMLSLLNLAAIIYRIVGLTRGLRYSWGICYQQAMRRWAGVLLLNFIGAAVLLTGVLPVLQKLINLLHIRPELIGVMIYALVPFGVVTFICVVDQNKNPFRAILAALDILSHKTHLHLWLCTSLMYAIPMLLKTYIALPGSYFSLFISLWALFCHIVTVVIYSTIINATITPQKDKNTKVVII